jgi:hypothetical protein
MSVIPLKADIHQRGLHVRFVPKTDITLTSRLGCLPLNALECRANVGNSNLT